jgi:RNA-directed DNA polymerase
MDKKTRNRLLTSLKLAALRAADKGWKYWASRLTGVASECEIGLEIEGLEQIRPVLKAINGRDPLEGDTHPEGEKQPGLARSETGSTPSLQDLRGKIGDKAKADKAWRFWGLFVHVAKLETLQEAYRLAKRNNGAPGIDGVTFDAIEESGVEAFLGGLHDELVSCRYKPMRNRLKEIPKADGKIRTLGIPTIRDRVVQGALKLILEPIFEVDFQPGSFGYRPKRTAHEAVSRVEKAILRGKTRVIDVDLKSFFDNVRHHILLEKVAKRVKDDEVMRLLRMILKATGNKGVPQGGVISPLLSNIYLNEVDQMLERAKNVTRQGEREYVEYARYADDLVILVGPHPRQGWLMEALAKRLRGELAGLQVEVNEEKTRTVDLGQDESFGFLGFEFRRVKSRSGKWRPNHVPKLKKRTALLEELKKAFLRFRSQPITRLVETINPILRGWVTYFRVGNSARCFSYVRLWVKRKIRRHLAKSRGRRGLGWKRWSDEWLIRELGLFNDYRVVRYQSRATALTSPGAT